MQIASDAPLSPVFGWYLTRVLQLQLRIAMQDNESVFSSPSGHGARRLLLIIAFVCVPYPPAHSDLTSATRVAVGISWIVNRAPSFVPLSSSSSLFANCPGAGLALGWA